MMTRLSIKPREARIAVSRILRQATWDWGLEPAVTLVVLAAHCSGHDGLGVLEREWETIRTARPEKIKVKAITPDVWQFDCASCHAFVAMPSLVDHLVQGVRLVGSASVTVINCVAPSLLAILKSLEAEHRLSIAFAISPDGAVQVTATQQTACRAPSIFVPLADYTLPIDCWRKLQQLALDYLVPESETSRRHAGDGTREPPPTAPLEDQR